MLERTGLDALEDLEVSELPLARTCHEARAELPEAAPGQRNHRDEPPLPTWRVALQSQKKAQTPQRMLSRKLNEQNRAAPDA